MATRQELHAKLSEITPNVYYQPPATVRMRYPCFVYDLADVDTMYADNRVYGAMNAYTVTYICPLPAEEFPKQMLETFRYIRFERPYTADNLHHYTFRLYY